MRSFGGGRATAGQLQLAAGAEGQGFEEGWGVVRVGSLDEVEMEQVQAGRGWQRAQWRHPLCMSIIAGAHTTQSKC